MKVALLDYDNLKPYINAGAFRPALFFPNVRTDERVKESNSVGKLIK